MNMLKKRLFSLSVGVISIFTIFGVGFYIGNSKSNSFSVNASEAPADLAPFWKVWYTLEKDFAPINGEELGSDERVWGAIKGLADSYGDPYTVFLPPEEKEAFDSSITGAFGGIGAEVGIRDGVLTVVAPLKDTPAWNAGILSGDIILKIDDVNSAELSIDEAVSLMRGERGTTVKLTLLRDNLSEPVIVDVVRDKITIPTIDTDIIDGVYIISLYNFNSQATDLFRNAMREFYLSGNDKLILDLRGNPGGYLDASIDIASWFLPAGKVIVRESFANGEEQVFRSKGYNVIGKRNANMVVLVDKGSASASEIVAGALQEHGVAELVGSQTFGKGSVQELINVTDNTSLKITIARWLTPNGVSISKGGLTPDHVVEFNFEDDSVVDAQLEKAMELLK